MPPAESKSLIRRMGIALFFALYFFFLLTSTGRVRTMDEVSVDFQAESLALRASTAIPQAVPAGLFYGKMDRRGQPRAPYGAGQAVLILPWHYAARVLRVVLPGIPGNAEDIFLDAVVTSSSAAFAALAATLAFWIFCRLGIGTRMALWVSLLLALGTQLFAYSAWFFSEPLVSAILLGAALVLFTGRGTEDLSPKLGALAGLLLGIALWVRPTHVIAAPVFLLALLIRDREKGLRAAAVLAAVVGIFGGAYLLRNQIYFGSPLDFGYPDAAEGGKRLNTFETPLGTGLFGLLFSPGKSIFLFAPPVLLAIPGVLRLAKRDLGLATVAGVMPLAYLFFFAKYTQWEGGYCVGPRYLVPAVTLLCLGLGPTLADASPRMRQLAVILFAAGMLMQLISISTSFVEDQALGTYYDPQWNYRMDYASVFSQGKLLLQYLGSPAPAKIGLGFDRWFVFLVKAGVARGLVAVGLLLEFSGFCFFCWRLKNAFYGVRAGIATDS